MTWAARRKFFIVALLLGAVVLAGFLFYSPVIFRAPSCTDMNQNGDETGVDCGGSCVNFCSNEAREPAVLWSRSFQVTGSIYNAVAYIENPNNAAIESIPYEFRVYNDKGVFIVRKQGTALIPPKGRYAIVETSIDVGTATVGSTTFAFANEHGPWQRIEEGIAGIRLATGKISLENVDSVPRLTATLTNPSPTTTLTNVTVAAILYDASDNAINASRTLIREIPADSSIPVFFTWPKPLSAPVVRYELIPIIDVFHTED